MIGGEASVVKHLDPIFAQLAPGPGDIPRTPGRETLGGTAERGYLHCGPNGAGHFVKMVHNGIEYGVMTAYAEGLGVLRGANVGKRTRAIDRQGVEGRCLLAHRRYRRPFDRRAGRWSWSRSQSRPRLMMCQWWRDCPGGPDNVLSGRRSRKRPE